MEKQLNRLEDKLDSLDKRLDNVDIKLAVYNEQLIIHIAGVQEAREEIKRVDDDLKPIKKHVAMVEGALKLIGLGATLASLVAGAFSIIHYIGGK